MRIYPLLIQMTYLGTFLSDCLTGEESVAGFVGVVDWVAPLVGRLPYTLGNNSDGGVAPVFPNIDDIGCGGK